MCWFQRSVQMQFASKVLELLWQIQSVYWKAGGKYQNVVCVFLDSCQTQTCWAEQFLRGFVSSCWICEWNVSLWCLTYHVWQTYCCVLITKCVHTSSSTPHVSSSTSRTAVVVKKNTSWPHYSFQQMDGSLSSPKISWRKYQATLDQVLFLTPACSHSSFIAPASIPIQIIISFKSIWSMQVTEGPTASRSNHRS